MRFVNLRKQLKQEFSSASVDEAEVDFIASEVLGVKRTGLVFVDELENACYKRITRLAKMRLTGVPIDQLFGYCYFCGFKFFVNKQVLTPRGDSEVLIEKVVEIVEKNNIKTVLDMCTGSGCLAITLKKLCGDKIDITAVDISGGALKIAKKNAKFNKANIRFVKSDMFNKVDDKYDLIVCNPPYIESETILFLDKEVRDFDPQLALDGGRDGLDFYRVLARDLKQHLNKDGFVVLEIGYNQQASVKALFKDYNFVACFKDFGGQDRVLIFRR